jgi:prevent-host-death family protein
MPKAASTENYLNVSDIRKNLSEILNQVAYGRTRIVLGRRGREIAALVPIEDLESLRNLIKTVAPKPPGRRRT